MDLIGKLNITNRRDLAKTISLVESDRPEDQELSNVILQEIYESLNHDNRIHTKVIAITGTPGAGKSTFIDAFGTTLADQNFKIAVLAIDPSSNISAGSILGDKTRMISLAAHPNAFIRPSPSKPGTLGGLAPETEDVISILRAAKFDYIFIETIGVGQNESDVMLLADQVIMIISPATGDELQGIKKGNLEYIDHLVINKFDGSTKDLALATADEYRSAFKGLQKRIFLTSAIEKTGFTPIIEALNSPAIISFPNELLLQRRIEKRLFKELSSLPSVAKILEDANQLSQPTRTKTIFFIERLKKLLT